MDHKILYCKSYAYSAFLNAKLFLIIYMQKKIIVCIYDKKPSIELSIDGLDKIIKEIFFFEDFSEKYFFVSKNKIITNKKIKAKTLLYPNETVPFFAKEDINHILDYIFTS